MDTFSYEIILVDDASTDRSPELCRWYAAQDGRIRAFFLEENGGAGIAKQAGLEHAIGEYVFFLDSDDEIMSEGFSKTIEELKKSSVDLVMMNYNRERDELNDIKKMNVWKELTVQEFIFDYLDKISFWVPLWRYIFKKDETIFGCPFAGNAYALRAIPSAVDEYIDLQGMDAEKLREAIKSFQKKTYFKICNYCKGRPKNFADIPAAIQAKQVLPYHRYE